MEKKEQQQLSGVYFIIGILIGLMVGFGLESNVFNDAILSVLSIGMISSLGEFFLQFCYQPGNIFGWYRDWLDKHLGNNPNSPLSFFYQPLGACAYCQNTWLTFGVFLLGNIFFGVSWWLLFPSLFLSHLFLTALDYTFWR